MEAVIGFHIYVHCYEKKIAHNLELELQRTTEGAN
jgi:hypothetical protein